MTSSAGGSASPHLTSLREAQDRALEAEGIPMVLVLLDHRDDDGGAPLPGAATPEGRRLATAMDEVRDALLPGHRGSDLGATGAVLQAVSYADFGRALDPSQRLGATS